MSLIADVRKITAEAVEKIRENQAAGEKLEQQREYLSDTAMNRAKAELDAKYNEIVLGCERKVSERVEQYKRDITAADVLDGSKLTDDAKLLSGGFALTVEDLRAMFQRNTGNRTMEILIHRHAKDHGLDIGIPFYTADEKAADADSLVSYARSVCQRPEYFDTMGSDEYFSTALSDSIKND